MPPPGTGSELRSDVQVKWPTEDPSEFRPEYQSEMYSTGKDLEKFRVFTEVNKILGVVYFSTIILLQSVAMNIGGGYFSLSSFPILFICTGEWSSI